MCDVGLKGYANAQGGEFRIKSSVFQGLVFSSGISPAENLLSAGTPEANEKVPQDELRKAL